MHSRCPELQEECTVFVFLVYNSKVSLSGSTPRAAKPPPAVSVWRNAQNISACHPR